jgi:hypothetical protein
MLDLDDHPAAVDVTDFEAYRLGCTESGCVGGRQRRAGLQARDCLEKPRWRSAQPAACVARGRRDRFRNLAVAERDLKEKSRSQVGLN